MASMVYEIKFRVSKENKETIRRIAESYGMITSQYARFACLHFPSKQNIGQKHDHTNQSKKHWRK